MWAEIRERPDVASELRRLRDTPQVEADYRFSWEVTQRMMKRPGFMEHLADKLAELKERYPGGGP